MRVYNVEFYSNNANVMIAEQLQAANLPAAIKTALQMCEQLNSTGGSVPSDFRIRQLVFFGEV